MSAIRPLATIAILAVLGVFLAMQINKGPKPLASNTSGDWGTGETAPAFDASTTAGGTAGGDAPSFAPPANAAGSYSGFEQEAPQFNGPKVGDQPADDPSSPLAGFPDLPSLPELPENNAGGSDYPSTPLNNQPQGNQPTANNQTAGGLQSGGLPNLPDLPLPENIPDASYPGARSSEAVDSSAASNPYGNGNLPMIEGGPYPVEPSTPIANPNLNGGANGYASQTTPIQAPASTAFDPYSNQPGLTGPANSTSPQMSGAAPGGFDAARGAIESQLQQGDLTSAHRSLTKWYGDPSLTAEQKQEVDLLLSQLAGSVVYSTEHRLAPAHQVQPGETLQSLSQQYGTPAELLGKINGISPTNPVQPGQIVKVIRGPFGAVVDLSKGELALMVDGCFAGRFAATPSGTAVTEGTWRVEQKNVAPGSSPLPAPTRYGSAATPSSSVNREIVMSNGRGQSVTIAEGTPGYGTSGTISVASNDMSDLYDILSVGSEIVVRR